MPVDERLTNAAALLRLRELASAAAEARPGNWRREGGLLFSDDAMVCSTMPSEWLSRDNRPAARYIAAMQPDVGLALVDAAMLLTDLERQRRSGCGACGPWDCPVCDAYHAHSDDCKLVAVLARLGEVDVG